MADQAINALSTKTTPETSDQLLLVGTGEPQLIDYDKLADSILNKITSKNYALDAGQMTLLAALNKLNSETPRKNVTSLEEYIKTAPYGISLCDCQIAKDNPVKGQMSICLSYVDEQHKWALQYVFSYNKIFYRVMSNLVFNDWAKIVG